MRNRAVAEAFARDCSPSGSGSHFFFEGRVIYSYGRHFPIARKLDNQEVLFNTDGYSTTTSCHKGRTRRALEQSGWKIHDISLEGLEKAIAEKATNMNGLILTEVARV